MQGGAVRSDQYRLTQHLQAAQMIVRYGGAVRSDQYRLTRVGSLVSRRVADVAPSEAINIG